MHIPGSLKAQGKKNGVINIALMELMPMAIVLTLNALSLRHIG